MDGVRPLIYVMGSDIQYNTKSIYMLHFQKAQSAYRETLKLHDRITIMKSTYSLKRYNKNKIKTA